MSKGKRYCSIQKWIEENDKKLYEFLEDNCLLGIFKFRHGTSGVTFLCPSAKDWKAIEKDIESGDYVNGVNTLKAHVLQGFYPNIAGLMEQQDGLVNTLGQLVEVEKQAGAAVVLKNGAKITDAKFVGTPDRQNIMVFHYDGKCLPTNAPAASLKYTSAPSGKKSKSGGGFRGMNKLSMTKSVEQRALNLIKQKPDLYMSHNPYAAALVSLYAHAHSSDKAEADKLYPLLDVFPEQAFYAIVQPYGTSDQDSLVQSWLDATGGMYVGSNPCRDYLKILKLDEKKGPEASGVIGRPEAMAKAVTKQYGGDKNKLAGDAVRWFIAVRRGEEPQLFSNPQKFITLVYDIAILFSGGLSGWLEDRTGEGAFLGATRYFQYNFRNSVPEDSVSVATALSGGAPDGHLVAADEKAQVEALRTAAAEVNDDGDSTRYVNANKAYEALFGPAPASQPVA
jgi:hypothetical protein